MVHRDLPMFRSSPQGTLYSELGTYIALNGFHRANALIIHYTSNNQVIQENEMILIDAACEYKSVVSSDQNVL